MRNLRANANIRDATTIEKHSHGRSVQADAEVTNLRSNCTAPLSRFTFSCSPATSSASACERSCHAVKGERAFLNPLTSSERRGPTLARIPCSKGYHSTHRSNSAAGLRAALSILTRPSVAIMKLSVILPARDEATSLATLLPQIRQTVGDAEIIVVDDGSNDNTAQVAREAGASVIVRPYSIGNGAAIKAGARMARGDVLIFMDADGQHDPADIPRLVERLSEGYDMVVGARDAASQASIGRGFANWVYNRTASLMIGHRVEDLTSGFRAARTKRFRQFLYLLPNGFSYPTTITMAFFRSGYSVAYVPIKAARREGESHIRPLRDGVRFLIILFKVATLYSPLKVFLPASMSFLLLGIGYYLYTFITAERFTNMSALLLSAGTLTFLMGLLSEQITALSYRDQDRGRCADNAK